MTVTSIVFCRDAKASEEDQETAEEKAIRENPGVPVITNLEDLYKMPRLQKVQQEEPAVPVFGGAMGALLAVTEPCPESAAPPPVNSRLSPPSRHVPTVRKKHLV